MRDPDELAASIIARIRQNADAVDADDVARTAATLNRMAAIIEGEFGALAGEHTPYRRAAGPSARQALVDILDTAHELGERVSDNHIAQFLIGQIEWRCRSVLDAESSAPANESPFRVPSGGR